MPVIDYSRAGVPFTRWVVVGMPRLAEYKEFLRTVFYLYDSTDSALRGAATGRTGFLVYVKSKHQNIPDHIYGVSNWHNVCQDGCSVVRLNTFSDTSDVFDLGPEDWHFIPGGPDIAVTPLQLSPEVHPGLAMDTSFFLTAAATEQHDIGPGDDVCMIGRFVDYDGTETNEPAVRFGNISIMSADVKQTTGYKGRSIVLDMHSRTGYSGSPVFVYQTAGSIFAQKKQTVTGSLFMLLGIHWGQFPEIWEIKQGRKANQQPESSLILEGSYVKGLSGMTCVCPADDIQCVLNLPKLQGMRDEAEEAYLATHPEVRDMPVAESAPPTTDENPQHREDFNRLLDEATKEKQ